MSRSRASRAIGAIGASTYRAAIQRQFTADPRSQICSARLSLASQPALCAPMGLLSPAAMAFHTQLPGHLGRSMCTLLSPPQEALRRRQRETLTALERSLVRLDGNDDAAAVLRECVTTLDRLFLCCVLGEFNAGKSALLNALLGGRHCAEGVLPTTSTLSIIKHPDVAIDVVAGRHTSGLDVLDLNVEWLRQLHLVDTPGTNSLDAAHTALTEDFLPRADLVLFVTSAERPFTQSEQVFINQVSAWRKKTLCVLTKADTLAAPALATVVEYVRTHATKTLGAPVAVSPVSAKIVLTLKERRGEQQPLGSSLEQFAENEAERIAAAQWKDFEDEVKTVLRSSGWLKLQSQLSTADRLLRGYEEAETSRREVVAADEDALRVARTRIDEFQKAMRRDAEAQRAKSLLVLSQLSERGSAFLQEELTLSQLPRLLRKDAFVKRFEQRVISGTSEQLERAAIDVADWMESRAAVLMRDTSELLQARLSRGPAGERRGDYPSKRQELLLLLRQSARDTVANYDASQASQRLVAATQSALAQTLLMQAGAAGLSSVVALKAASLMDLSGLLPAALLAITGFAVLPMQRYRLQKELREKVEHLKQSLNSTLEAHLEQELVRASSRAHEVTAPFVSLVESAQQTQAGRDHILLGARREIDALREEVDKAQLISSRSASIFPQ